MNTPAIISSPIPGRNSASGVYPPCSQLPRIGTCRRLMGTLLCTALSLMYFTVSRGNPILLDPSALPKKIIVDGPPHPPVMSAENVVISVGLTQSAVTGRYVFRRSPTSANRVVMINIPVLLPDGTAAEYEQTAGAPIVSLKDGKLPMHRVPPPFTTRVSIPAGWNLSWYGTPLPQSKASGDLHLTITYIQPSFADGRVGYVPFFPPTTKGAGRIVFRAAHGHGLALRRSGVFSFLSPARSELTFRPRHRKLIAVRAR